MTPVRWAVVLAMLAMLGAALAYLRDPPWLATMTSGMRPWTTGADGTRYRWVGSHSSFFVPWTAGADGTRYRWVGSHSSFFVPSTATVVTIPMRATFGTPGEWPITATISIDDRPADQVTLSHDEWRTIEFRLPEGSSRKHRRIDIRLDRTRHDNHGVQLGEIQTR